MLKLHISLYFGPLLVKFSILCSDNAVFIVWLSLGTETTWSELGKDHVLAWHGRKPSRVAVTGLAAFSPVTPPPSLSPSDIKIRSWTHNVKRCLLQKCQYGAFKWLAEILNAQILSWRPSCAYLVLIVIFQISIIVPFHLPPGESICVIRKPAGKHQTF